MVNKVLYFGNFDYLNGFAAVNRAIGNGILLSKLGYTTKIYCSNIPNNFIDEESFLTQKGVILQRKEPRNKISSYICCSNEVQLINSEKPSIVILYNIPYIVGIKILKYCKKQNIAVVNDITEWFDVKAFRGVNKILKSFDTYLRMHRLAKMSDGIITISSYLTDYYKKRVKNLIQVYPLMDYLFFFENKIKKNSNSLNLGYLGVNRKGKDSEERLGNILSKIEFNQNINLYVAGKLNIDKLSSLFCGKNISIHELGLVGRNSIVDLYSILDYSLIFRNHTRANNAGFPTKFAESIFMGVPVLCNDFSDLRNIIEKYNCGVIVDDKQPSISLPKKCPGVTKEAKGLFLSDSYKEQMSFFLENFRSKSNER